ncbi:MAG: hypothetical protein JWM95_4473, partial [Gemmatimonadetes bacterium]|nr:hypothetical protein [Gemmatimonadota bacterium]
SKSRLLLVLAVIGYVTAFHVTYRDVISPNFEFWGLGYRHLPVGYFWTTVMFCIIPSLWMPVTFSRPTLLLFYMQYLLIYVPAAFLVFYCDRPILPIDLAMQIVCWMFVGLSIMQSIYLIPIRTLTVLRLTPEAFWAFFGSISLVMLAYIAITLGSNFRLASFADVNSVRYAMSDIIASTGSRFGAYSQFLLLALFLPTFFVVGADKRRWSLLVAVALAYIFIFGVSGAKQAALSIVYLPLAYALLSRSTRRIPLLFICGLTAALLSGYLALATLSRLPAIEYLSVVHFRLFTVPPLSIPQYADFFQSHPLTHLSHVTGLSSLLHFPYEENVSYTIGRYYYHTILGANSGLWATDGIGSFGLVGIPIISCFAGIVLWILDSVAADMDPSFVGVMLTYCAVSFTNVSIFTTLITGGLAFLIVALAAAPRDARGHIQVPRLSRPTSRSAVLET